MTIWYNIGTATATNGSAAVTGALTAWLANVKPGDEFYFTADARGYEVLSVESNTSLTLATNYAGTTGSSKAYATKQIGPGWNSVTELSVSVADLMSAVGNQVVPGTGVPNDAEGIDGDGYFRTDVPSIYAKESGVWVLKATIVGATGSAGPSYQATSTSSVTIGTGSKSFTLAENGRGYTVNQRLRASNSATNYMEGTVTSYSGTTLIINVDRVGGSGTLASWNVNITGDAGPANSITAGSVTTGSPGTNASVNITGTAPNQVIEFTIPRGATGTTGATGPQGSSGAAATIAVGTITTLDPGDSATVSNTGSSSAAVFAFGIPQGETGDPGASINPTGDYDNGTTYSENDVVRVLGSSWVYINVTPGAGNAPPTLPTTSNSYWELLAEAGTDGTGAVDLVNGQTGIVVLSGSDIEANHSAVNYTPGGSSIADHFAGLDAANAPGAAPTTTVASAGTCDIGSASSLAVTISGTTTITSFGTAASKWRMVTFSGALTLTHNGTSLILPAGANVTTLAGESAIFKSDGSGNWRCMAFPSRWRPASDTVAGGVELATSAETSTGTDATRALTPDGLRGSDFGKTVIGIQPFRSAADVTTGDAAGGAMFRVPTVLNGFNIVAVAANVSTAGTTGTTDIQIRRVRSGTPADVLSTKITIDSTEVDTLTAATAAVINTSNDDLATGDQIYIDVDATSTTKPKGLYVELTLQK